MTLQSLKQSCGDRVSRCMAPQSDFPSDDPRSPASSPRSPLPARLVDRASPPQPPEQQHRESLQQNYNNRQLCICLMFLQCLCVPFYSPWCLEYKNTPAMGLEYTMFQHVNVMIFLGFGLLMVCNARLAYSSMVTTFVIGAVCMQYGMLFHHFWASVLRWRWERIQLSISDLVLGNFASATVLISYGAVIGRVTPAQMVAAALVQVPLYSLNESILAAPYSGGIEAIDMGGSMFVHTFGALSGVVMSKCLRRTPDAEAPRPIASYHSDILALVGTAVLWMFWPSFNGALAVGAGWHRVVLNTTLALAASCVSSVAVAAALAWDGALSMEIIQNASLAGGVMVGSSSDLVIGPHWAMVIGLCAGVVASLGFAYGKQWLRVHVGVDDVCGVMWLHGVPGILGGCVGAMSAAFSGMDEYTSASRSQNEQAALQLAALCVTVCMACATGAAMAAVANCFTAPRQYMTDKEVFEVPRDFPRAVW